MPALGPVEVLFLVAPLAVVPLALRLLDGGSSELRGLRRFQFPAAALALAAFFPARGPWAALWSAGWMLFTLAVAAHGARRLWRGVTAAAITAGDVAAAGGCLLLPVGGAWLVLSRSGTTVWGFEEPIPLLTAVHFHYAAFAALTLVAQAGRVLAGALYRAIVGSALAGPLLVAAGITSTPVLELAGAAILTAAISTLSVQTLVRIVPRSGSAAGSLLAVSSLSALAGMACALAYAIGQATDLGVVSLGQMARLHGPLNGLGFCLCGLAGWCLLPRNPGLAHL